MRERTVVAGAALAAFAGIVCAAALAQVRLPEFRAAAPRDLGRGRDAPLDHVEERHATAPHLLQAPPNGKALSACYSSLPDGIAWTPGLPGGGGGSGGPLPPSVRSNHANEAWVADRGQISGGAGWRQLVTYDSRGTLVRWLTDNPWDHRAPDWSPVFNTGEQWIAYLADEDDDRCSDLWRIRADGSGASKLHVSIPEHPTEGCPNGIDWSPDGRWLLVTGSGLVVHDATTGEVVADVTPDSPLTGSPLWPNSRASWSADRDCDHGNGLQTRVAYSAVVPSDVEGSPSVEIFMFDLLVTRSGSFRTGPAGQLTFSPPRWRNEQVAWSPDGERLVFRQDPQDPPDLDEPSSLLIYELSTAETTEALPVSRGITPRWSPDGTKLSFKELVTTPGGGDPASNDIEIHWMELDGTQLPVQVTDDNNDNIGAPDWNPGWIDDLE